MRNTMMDTRERQQRTPASTAPDFPEDRVAAYTDAGLWQGKTVADELRDAATQHADTLALITPEVRWTYAELDEHTEDFAAGVLASTPLEPGDRVMFQMGNVAETVVAYYGALKAGLVPVCTLPLHREREIGLLARHTGARAHFVQADFRDYDLTTFASRLHESEPGIDVLLVARGEVPDGTFGFDDICRAGRGPQARAALAEFKVDPRSIAVLQLSGGTTGLPKVAPRRHEEYVYNARSWAQTWEFGPGSVVMHPLPIMHNAGIAAAMQPAHLTGATFVLAPDPAPDTIIDLVERERVTVLPVVPPAVAIRLLDHERTPTADLTSLKLFVVGGQKLPEVVADRIEDELRLTCLQMFGMAEGMFTATPPDAPEWIRKHTVGIPVSPLDEVRVCLPGEETEVADGELGELCCRGPYTIPGYYQAPEHNASTFTSDGFYRTGDLACRHVVDGRAYYSIDGRIKDVINRGVEKIHAEEVEEIVLRHPGIHAVALVAMPDPVLGERACAYLILEPGQAPLSVAVLGHFLLGEGLAKYKLPERVEIVTEFPLTNVGKISKKDLRADAAAKLEAELEAEESR